LSGNFPVVTLPVVGAIGSANARLLRRRVRVPGSDQLRRGRHHPGL